MESAAVYEQTRCQHHYQDYFRAETHVAIVTSQVNHSAEELHCLQCLRLVARVQREEERQRQELLLTVRLASHPRIGKALPMGMLDDELLAMIAHLTV